MQPACSQDGWSNRRAAKEFVGDAECMRIRSVGWLHSEDAEGLTLVQSLQGGETGSFGAMIRIPKVAIRRRVKLAAPP